MRWKRIYEPVFLLALLWPAAVASAEQTPTDAIRPVGHAAIEYSDPGGARSLKADLWYPAAAGTGDAQTHYDYAFRARALLDAQYLPATARRPLVLLSHGDKGSQFDQSWLAESLAANGYIVAALAHWMNTWRHNEPEGTLRVWERPRDLSTLLSQLLADPVWGPRIDATQIAAAGHSSGGYAVLALAGAVYVPARMAQYCWSPERGPDCKLAEGVRLERVDFTEAGKNYRDERIRAVLAMAPALGPGMEPASLKTIAVPVRILAAEDDEILPPEQHAGRYARDISGVRLTRLAQGGHFVFMPECTFMGKAFTFFHSYDICGRRAKADRAALHEQIAQEALSFFSAARHSRSASVGSTR